MRIIGSSGRFLGSPRAIFRVRPGVGHIEPKVGVWGQKNDFQKSIQERTLRVGESKKTPFLPWFEPFLSSNYTYFYIKNTFKPGFLDPFGARKGVKMTDVILVIPMNPSRFK